MCVLLSGFLAIGMVPCQRWDREDGSQVSHLLGEVGELAAASAEVVLDLDSGGSVRRGRPGGGGGASI